jgi:hypothetical protein
MKFHLKLRETKKQIDWFIKNALMDGDFEIFVSKKTFKVIKPILSRANEYNGYKIFCM